MKIRFMKQISWCLVVAMFIIGIVPNVQAGFAPSDVIALLQVDRAADIGKIQKVLETKMVRERLGKLGYAQEEINSRFAQLSDQQIHNLALQIDEIKVGGDSGLGIVIALLVIAILVVLFIQLTGHRVVVTK
ncbi:MAG TPA: PA2779 family protein [Candidatus Wunengus sp. YC61]|uniref:PA2779 family protein n=1 Tax=Candidatus Wunengus sp. YC61 TaxID=3367698 RepID=UPI004028DD2A